MYLNLQHSPFQHYLFKLKSITSNPESLFVLFDKFHTFRGIIKKDKRPTSILFIERLLVGLLYTLKPSFLSY